MHFVLFHFNQSAVLMILSIMTLEVTRMVPCLIDVEEDEENEKDFSP